MVINVALTGDFVIVDANLVAIAERIERDGIRARVSQDDLHALAAFVREANEEAAETMQAIQLAVQEAELPPALPGTVPACSATLAVAIVEAIRTYDDVRLAERVAENSPAAARAAQELADARDDHDAAFNTLKTRFEQEFPYA